jgi:hypothetical protein
MNTQQVLRKVESLDFGCYPMVASSVQMFTRLLGETEEVKYLIQLNDPDLIKARIEVLLWCDQFYDTNYRSEFEVAVATYLYILDKLNVEIPYLNLDSRWFYAGMMNESSQSF